MLATKELSKPAPHSLFDEVASDAGLEFTHVAGRSSKYYLIEIMGSGVALFDFDNDGDLDVYLVQGHSWQDDGAQRRPKPPRPGDRLFRNDLIREGKKTTLHFTDVTESSGIVAKGYGMGVAAGDFDNDGYVDLYVTNFGANQLWRNNGDGTFADVTDQSGTDDLRWSTSAAFVDYDRDGWLDLFVCNYVNYSLARYEPCYDAKGALDYCGPAGFAPQGDRLFRNRGDGTFEDVTVQSRITTDFGAGLGVVCSDLDGNQWPDIYVANDGMPNHCWMNQGDGTFRNDGILSGAAVNEEGRPEASMGVAAADFDHDGDDDLFMTHWAGESNTLYVNSGNAQFRDSTAGSGLGGASRPFTAFGTAWLDYDNDGWLDIVAVNGAVQLAAVSGPASSRYPLGQSNQLFRNRHDGSFQEESVAAGQAFLAAETSRGVAVGDVDNDGDQDFVVCNNNGPVRLFRNESATQNAWCGLRLIGSDHPRDMLGTVVQLVGPTGKSHRRTVRTDGSYCSASDPRLLFRVAEEESINHLEVHWPSGHVERFSPPATGRYTTICESTGVEIR